VFSEMDYRVGVELSGEPGVEGEISMRWHQSRIVIGRFRVDVVAARGLDQHSHIAGAEAENGETATIEPARTEEGVAFGGTPAVGDGPLDGWRKGREEGRIFGER